MPWLTLIHIQDQLKKRLGPSEVLPVLAFLSFFAYLHLQPALQDCQNTIVGGPGDATSGGVWMIWQWLRHHVGPWPAITPDVNAPFNEGLWRPIQITSLLVQFPMWLISLAAGPVCGWTLSVAFGFLLSGFAMFLFVRSLTASIWISAIAAYAYAFSPYHLAKAQGHIGYVHSETLVLLIWALLFFWNKPNTKRGVLLGATLAGCFYSDGYYILIGTITAVAGCLIGFILFRGQYERGSFATAFRGLLASGITFVLAVLPIVFVFLSQRSVINSQVSSTRTVAEVETYGARPLEYLMPPRSNPFLSRYFAEYQDAHLHGSNYSEQTLTLGWTIICLAVFAVVGAAVAFYKSRRLRSMPDRAGPTLVPEFFLLFLLLSAGLFSGSGHFSAFGKRIPSLSGLVFDLVHYWRVFARFFLAVDVCAIALAALGLARLVRRRGLLIKTGVGVLVFPLIFLEYLTWPPRATWSYQQAPAIYQWIRNDSQSKLIAEYPLVDPPDPRALDYLTTQYVHRKRMLNSSLPDSAQKPIRDGLGGLGDTQTLAGLRVLGVDTVFVHWESIGDVDPDTPPAGLEHIAHFEKSDAYRIGFGPRTDLVLSPTRGFYTTEFSGWCSQRWMGTRGRLKVLRLSGIHSRAQIHFHASSYRVPRTLTIKQGSAVVWRGSVEETDVSFTAATKLPFDLTVSPAAEIGPGSDSRQLSLLVTELLAVPID